MAPKESGAGNSGLSRNTPPAGVLRTAQTASSHTPKRKPKSSHSANTARAARLIATFHGTRFVRRWSWRVGAITGARGLELDMFGVGECLDMEVIRVLATMRGVGRWCWWGGGVKEMQVHTGDEKTTKRWEADDRARDRLK